MTDFKCASCGSDRFYVDSDTKKRVCIYCGVEEKVKPVIKAPEIVEEPVPDVPAMAPEEDPKWVPGELTEKQKINRDRERMILIMRGESTIWSPWRMLINITFGAFIFGLIGFLLFLAFSLTSGKASDWATTGICFFASLLGLVLYFRFGDILEKKDEEYLLKELGPGYALWYRDLEFESKIPRC